jgi:cellulose synthase/poly-beta-1,6-N-acetylglucosamine synthase-like glycosyltransferase
MSLLGTAILLIAVLLLAQSLFSLYLMLYTWEYPERLIASKGPSVYRAPQHSFTVLLPARHEEAVISETIRRVLAARYPEDLLEVVVICSVDDHGTIAEARRAIQALGTSRVRVETFDTPPINKPHGLNVGLARSTFDVVTVFDAEDDIDPDIFQTVNTVMLEEKVGIVQAGVQLMNLHDHWFSVHNCMEYFFWFKSRLHFHAQAGMVPLGGNTVFIRRALLEQVGGWDETCLTEDAEIGLRLSVLGERTRVVYDALHVTREETPGSVEQFIRQRTRWHQGFLQVLLRGRWREMQGFGPRLLAAYTFTYPLLQAFLLLIWPLTLISALRLHEAVPIVMVAFLPLYALLLQYLATAVGAYKFCRDYQLRFPLLLPLGMALTFLPFQWLQGIAAVRAVYRELRSEQNWEKTVHIGAHRQPVLAAYHALSALLETVMEYLQADHGSLLVRDPAANTYSLVSKRGLPDTIADQVERQLRAGPMQWVARTRRPLVLGGQLPPELGLPRATAERDSALVLPVEHEKTVVAMFYVGAAREQLGDDRLLSVLEQITRAVGDASSPLPALLGHLRAG